MSNLDRIGVIGVIQILLACILNVIWKLESKNLTYILLNLIDAIIACLA